MNEIAFRLAAKLFDKRLIENSYRSAFVEEMIAPFLSQGGWKHVGDGWNGWDFERGDGVRLELKQSAANQTWSDLLVKKVKPKPKFDIAARTGYFDAQGVWCAGPDRLAHVYVFAWNGTLDETTDHRNPDQWEFYVVGTPALPKDQKSISLAGVQRLAAGTGQCGPTAIHSLLLWIDAVLKRTCGHGRREPAGWVCCRDCRGPVIIIVLMARARPCGRRSHTQTVPG